MNFLTYGDENKHSILFIHGMASTALLCYEPLLEYLNNYYVILAEVDGHSDRLDAAFLTKMGALTKVYEKLFCRGIFK